MTSIQKNKNMCIYTFIEYFVSVYEMLMDVFVKEQQTFQSP